MSNGQYTMEEKRYKSIFARLRNKLPEPQNRDAIAMLVMATPNNIGLSAYPFVDPYFAVPDPRPPTNGVVFNTGYMPHSRYVTTGPPLCATLIGTNSFSGSVPASVSDSGCGCGCNGSGK